MTEQITQTPSLGHASPEPGVRVGVVAHYRRGRIGVLTRRENTETQREGHVKTGRGWSDVAISQRHWSPQKLKEAMKHPPLDLEREPRPC